MDVCILCYLLAEQNTRISDERNNTFADEPAGDVQGAEAIQSNPL